MSYDPGPTPFVQEKMSRWRCNARCKQYTIKHVQRPINHVQKSQTYLLSLALISSTMSHATLASLLCAPNILEASNASSMAFLLSPLSLAAAWREEVLLLLKLVVRCGEGWTNATAVLHVNRNELMSWNFMMTLVNVRVWSLSLCQFVLCLMFQKIYAVKRRIFVCFVFCVYSVCRKRKWQSSQEFPYLDVSFVCSSHLVFSVSLVGLRWTYVVRRYPVVQTVRMTMMIIVGTCTVLYVQGFRTVTV